MNRKYLISIFIFFQLPFVQILAQSNLNGNLIMDEFLTRKNFLDSNQIFQKNMIRNSSNFSFFEDSSFIFSKNVKFKLNPIISTFKLDLIRPYSNYDNGLIPSRGFQKSFSAGFDLSYLFFNFQFNPEFIYSQNLPFAGFSDNFSSDVIFSRFVYWNSGDFPERFTNSPLRKIYLGHSKISFKFSFLELSFGTNNFWWGPGQWNSLIFSNNAPGFPHVSLNSLKPTKTFLGFFEGQILVGRLESSGENASQNLDLNEKFFTPLNSDWRFLNGFLLSYNPIWIPSLTLGFGRTFQMYNNDRPNGLIGYFPIFEPLSKEKLFLNGNSVIYDRRGQSQQISIFFNYKVIKSNVEFYAQFGRRDHALNWREFILNPEHARAYQFGFYKLFNVSNHLKKIQIRGEITNQQESVNRYLRYGLNGGLTWHIHGQVRGFTNFGQPMGVGISTGSNVQTLELAIVDNWKKFGILFERLENNQDFYYRAFGQQYERKPWIDYSSALLWNTSYKNLFFAARIQGTYARNYQWGLDEISNSDFPISQNLFSFHSQVNLIYVFKRYKNN